MSPPRETLLRVIVVLSLRFEAGLGANVSGTPTKGGIVISLKLLWQILLLYLTDARYGKHIARKPSFHWLRGGACLEFVERLHASFLEVYQRLPTRLACRAGR